MRARWTSQPNALNCGALRTLASSPAVFLAKSVYGEDAPRGTWRPRAAIRGAYLRPGSVNSE